MTATYADLRAVPAHLVAEIIDGAIRTRSHGHAQPAMARTVLLTTLRPLALTRNHPEARWQLLHLPELHLGKDVLVPDLAAWHVERLPTLPDDHFVLRPDWVCEFTGYQAEAKALQAKLALYASYGVEHLWTIDLVGREFQAFELHANRWNLVATASRPDIVSASPFEAISFSLADLWPLDKPLGLSESPQALYAGDR